MNQKLLLTLFAVFLNVFCMNAQKSQTVNVVDAGTLATLLGADKTIVTDLTLTGTINDADFTTIKQMTALKSLDMLNVDITNGTIPASAFANRVMDKLVLPKSLKVIGVNAFVNMVVPTLDFSVCPDLTTLGPAVFVGLKTDTDILDFSTNNKLVNFTTAYLQNNNWAGTFSSYGGLVVLPDDLKIVPRSTFEQFKGSIFLSLKLQKNRR